MTRKARVILVVSIIEVALAGLWYYLTLLSVTKSPDIDAPRVIGQTMGMVMGAVLGLGVVMLIVAAKADRAKP